MSHSNISEECLYSYHVWDRSVRIFHWVNAICIIGLICLGLILLNNKVIEVKNSGINKGRAASQRISRDDYEFILGIGDDWTDEYLFEELPRSAYTIKVGMFNTKAKYNVDTFNDVRNLLKKLAAINI